MNTSTPNIFEPLSLRNHQRYRSLKHHVFSPTEKLWIYFHVANEKANNAQQKSRYISEFCRRHSISSDIVEEWVAAIDRGEELVPSLCAPKKVDTSCCMDTIALEALNDFLMDISDTEEDQVIKDFIYQQMDATEDRRALAKKSAKPKPTKRVFIKGVFSHIKG
jgi:hypothetical protein